MCRSGRASAEEQKRNTEQNRYYWSAVLRSIAEHAEVGDRHYDEDVWHAYFARKFGLCDEVLLPDGEIVVRRKSTTQMSERGRILRLHPGCPGVCSDAVGGSVGMMRREKLRRLVAVLPCMCCGQRGQTQAAHAKFHPSAKAWDSKRAMRR